MSRLNQQEQTIMHLQSDRLKHEFMQQQHESEVAQFKWQLAERDKEVSSLRNELIRREKTLDKQRAELEDAIRHIEELKYAQVLSTGFVGVLGVLVQLLFLSLGQSNYFFIFRS